MNNASLRVLPTKISVPEINNHYHHESEQPNARILTSHESAEQAKSFIAECSFIMDSINDERGEPPPNLTEVPPPSPPAAVKPKRLSGAHDKEPVWQRRGRFLIWPAHLGDHLDGIPS
jgi:hypothetical protein